MQWPKLEASPSLHDDDDFADVMNTAVRQMATLAPLLGPLTSLLPARIGVEGDPPAEADFLRLAMQQYLKFSVASRA